MKKPTVSSALVWKARRVSLMALVVSLFAAPVFSTESDQQRFAKTLLLLRDANNSQVIAEVMPGTALHVLSQRGDRIQVEISGWSPAGGERYLFKAVGERIRQAKMTEEGMIKRVVIAEQEDAYESTWQNARITGWINSADTSVDINSIWRQAGELFLQRCTRCHALHRSTEFTANQWPSILKIMTVRAGLSAENKALVTAYLQIHAKGQGPVAEADDLVAAPVAQENPPLSPIAGNAKLATRGAALFQSKNCFACHGADARTAVVPTYPQLAGQSAEYAYKQMRDFKSGLRANDDFMVMNQAMDQVSDEEMRAIAYWLSTQ